MPGAMRSFWMRARHLRWIALIGAVVGMWYAAARQLAGIGDLLVFVPPAAVLGLAVVWAAHAFAPHRFTWRRGLMGAVVAAVVFGPLTAAVVTFAAAWHPDSFLLLFTVGAWCAVAAGLLAGLCSAVVRWLGRQRSPFRRISGARGRRGRRADATAHRTGLTRRPAVIWSDGNRITRS